MRLFAASVGMDTFIIFTKTIDCVNFVVLKGNIHVEWPVATSTQSHAICNLILLLFKFRTQFVMIILIALNLCDIKMSVGYFTAN